MKKVILCVHKNDINLWILEKMSQKLNVDFIGYSGNKESVQKLEDYLLNAQGKEITLLLDLMSGEDPSDDQAAYTILDSLANQNLLSKNVNAIITSASVHPNDIEKEKEYSRTKGFFSEPIKEEDLKKILSMT